MVSVTDANTHASEIIHFYRQGANPYEFGLQARPLDDQCSLRTQKDLPYFHVLRIGNATISFQLEDAPLISDLLMSETFGINERYFPEERNPTPVYWPNFQSLPSCLVSETQELPLVFNAAGRLEVWSWHFGRELLPEGRIYFCPEKSSQKELEATNLPVTERLKDLSRLELNWDGYGGRSPTREAIAKTSGLLLAIQGLLRVGIADPFIVPLPDGGIELDWTLDSGVELMLVISPGGGDVEYLLELPSDSAGEFVASEGFLPEDIRLSDLIFQLT